MSLGRGQSSGGEERIAARLADYPLLVCADGVVMTEDGIASVEAAWYHDGSDLEAAMEYGTTAEHIRQARAYYRRYCED